MSETKSKLPKEVEGLVEMVAREMAEDNDFSWRVLTGEIPMGKVADPEYWEVERTTNLNKYRNRARQLLTRINEHLGGRGVILDKDQAAPKIIVPSHSEGIVCPHCGEDFGIESEVETFLKNGQEMMTNAGYARVSCAIDGTPPKI